MVILILSIIVSIVLGGGVACLIYTKNQEGKGKKISYLFSLVGLLGFTIILFGSFTTVGANEVGIIYHDKHGVLDETLGEGFQMKSIFEHVTTISTANKTAHIQTTGQTQDSVFATFDITMVYKIETANASKFYKATSSTEISTAQINSVAKEALQAATIKEDIYTILGSSSDSSGNVTGSLETVRLDFFNNVEVLLFDRYGITLVSLSFDDIDAGERVEEVIKLKAEALQQIEIANAEAEAARIKAEADAAVKIIEIEAEAKMALIQANNELEKAEIEAQTKEAIANAEAEVIRIQAQAEADRINLEKTAIQNAINELFELSQTTDTPLTYEQAAEIILQQIYYDNWNGELPDYVGGDASVILPGTN